MFCSFQRIREQHAGDFDTLRVKAKQMIIACELISLIFDLGLDQLYRLDTPDPNATDRFSSGEKCIPREQRRRGFSQEALG
jgi:hypothetical protein